MGRAKYGLLNSSVPGPEGGGAQAAAAQSTVKSNLGRKGFAHSIDGVGDHSPPGGSVPAVPGGTRL